MINFFNNMVENNFEENLNIKMYPSYPRIKSIAGININMVKDYYYNTGRYLKRPNPLITIINNFDIDLSDTPDNVFNYLSTSSSYLANSIKFITTTNKNDDPFEKVIMPAGNEYILVANELTMPTNDRSILDTSIRCLYTNSNDYFFTHPKMYDYSTDFNYYVFTVDLVKLGLGYYYWCKEQIILDNDTDPARYLFTIVLTNTINDITDIMFINRFIAEYEKDVVNSWYNFNRIFIPDDTNRYEKLIHYSIDVLKKNKKITWKEALANIPTLLNINTLNLLKLPNITTNRRNEWVLWLARLPYLIFLIKHTDKHMNKQNIHYLKNTTVNSLKQLERNQYFSVENSTTNFLLQDLLNKIKKLLKGV